MGPKLKGCLGAVVSFLLSLFLFFFHQRAVALLMEASSRGPSSRFLRTSRACLWLVLNARFIELALQRR